MEPGKIRPDFGLTASYRGFQEPKLDVRPSAFRSRNLFLLLGARDQNIFTVAEPLLRLLRPLRLFRVVGIGKIVSRGPFV
jgi:hypothetical protein